MIGWTLPLTGALKSGKIFSLKTFIIGIYSLTLVAPNL